MTLVERLAIDEQIARAVLEQSIRAERERLVLMPATCDVEPQPVQWHMRMGQA
jgi:hypothetical protein